jgi:hypothetical protein
MSMLMSNSLGIPVSRCGGSSFFGTLLFAMYVPLLSVVVALSSDLSISSSCFTVRASSAPPPDPPSALRMLLLLWRRRPPPRVPSFGDLFPFFRSPPRRRRTDVGVVVVVVEHEQNRDDALRIIIKIAFMCARSCVCVCVCVCALYIYRKRVRAFLRVLFFLARIRVVGERYSRLIFLIFVSRSFARARMDPKNANTPRERGNVAAFEAVRVARNAQRSTTKATHTQKKKSDLSVDRFLDTKKGKKEVRVCRGAYISLSEKEKRNDARILVFFRIALSLCVFFRYVRARLVCELFFCVKLWVLLIILTTRARSYFSVFIAFFSCAWIYSC